MFYWWPECEPGSTVRDVLERAIERNEAAAADYARRLVRYGESNDVAGGSENRAKAIACYAAADVLKKVRSLIAPASHPSPVICEYRHGDPIPGLFDRSASPAKPPE